MLNIYPCARRLTCILTRTNNSVGRISPHLVETQKLKIHSQTKAQPVRLQSPAANGPCPVFPASRVGEWTGASLSLLLTVVSSRGRSCNSHRASSRSRHSRARSPAGSRSPGSSSCRSPDSNSDSGPVGGAGHRGPMDHLAQGARMEEILCPFGWRG